MSTKFSEAKILEVLKEYNSGINALEVCRKHVVGKSTLYCLLSTSKAKFVKRDRKIIHSQQNKNSPTPKNQKLGQELNTSSAPKPKWEATSPELSAFFALR